MTEALYTHNAYNIVYDYRQEMQTVQSRMGTPFAQGSPHLPEMQIAVLEQGTESEGAMKKGSKMSEVSRKRCTESRHRLWANPEYRDKCIKSHEGKIRSQESIKNQIKSREGYFPSEETKQKIRVSLTDKKHTPERIDHNRLAQKICKNTPDARKFMSELMKSRTGKLSPNWKGGVSFEPYCPKFNDEFKERVRAFFGHQCVECGHVWHEGEPRLAVHHVNFNKKTCCDNTIPLFVSLCPSCHSKTNYNRPYWREHFTAIINGKYGGKCYLPKGGPE